MIISINNVTKKFGKEKVAVKNASWMVPDGAITGLIGPNGAGKTATLKMITGVLKPDSGQILINNTDIVKDPVKAKEQFGFVFDTPDHFVDLEMICGVRGRISGTVPFNIITMGEHIIWICSCDVIK